MFPPPLGGEPGAPERDMGDLMKERLLGDKSLVTEPLQALTVFVGVTHSCGELSVRLPECLLVGVLRGLGESSSTVNSNAIEQNYDQP